MQFFMHLWYNEIIHSVPLKEKKKKKNSEKIVDTFVINNIVQHWKKSLHLYNSDLELVKYGLFF